MKIIPKILDKQKVTFFMVSHLSRLALSYNDRKGLDRPAQPSCAP